jgi:hypothetical protein
MKFLVRDEGELPKGLYCYVIVSTGSTSDSILQIYAKNKNNSIILNWMPTDGECRIYRGTYPDKFDGFFEIINCGWFCDDGRGLLNESQIDPWQ